MFKYALLFAFVLTGCAGALPWNPQGFAGLNKVEFQWMETERGEVWPRRVVIIDGKEQGTISFKFIMTDGSTMEFTASDVKAFEGQALRAGVEGKVIDATKEIIESGIDLAGDILVPIPDLTDDEPE